MDEIGRGLTFSLVHCVTLPNYTSQQYETQLHLLFLLEEKLGQVSDGRGIPA